MVNEIKCSTSTLILNWRNDKEIKCTFAERQTMYDKDVSFSQVKNSGCTGIRFENCIMLALPSSDSIKHFIPNLAVLSIFNSKLSKITAEDLKGFVCLQDLYVTCCEIEHLPRDLFIHSPNLEIVSFYDNKIKYIDEGILDPLQNLKMFCLLKNFNIDVAYDTLNNTGNVTLSQLKNEMRTKCKTESTFWKIENKLSSEIETLKKQIIAVKANEEVQKKENAELKRKYEDISGKFKKLRSDNENNLKKICIDQTEKNENIERKLKTVQQQFQKTQQVPKDFTIKVNEKHFNVNKEVLKMHSKVLAKLITENPEVNNLELNDISKATFQEILNFMNDGSSPSKDSDMIGIFEASFRLEADALTTIVADLLKEKVTQCDALDVLLLCNKYDTFNHYDELKMKAFAEYQKNFPHHTFKSELASQPEKLEMILMAKLEMDEMIVK